jgi:1-aminocyclopropane-1-carboxylate deaminase/D-cysteine desulfhydrase-like pyridoxal-dependent ACC family enzyme
MKDYKYHELTPVEKHGGFFFKRDDLYKPFEDFDITGGKTRQCLYLVETNLDSIRRDSSSTIATAASVHSPQATIVARVAKEFGLKCIIGHGAKDPLKHRAMQMCVDLGAELVTLVTNNAYNNVLYSHLARLNQTRPFFTINFGYQALTNPEAIIEMNANQVKNLPDDLDMLVVNVGSGVSGSGILVGLEKYKPHLLKNKDFLHFIQPFGYDRKETLCQAADFGTTFHYHQGNYPYHTPKKIAVDSYPNTNHLYLDEIYESKGFHYMITHLPVWQGKKVCYWLIGNSNVLRS